MEQNSRVYVCKIHGTGALQGSCEDSVLFWYCNERCLACMNSSSYFFVRMSLILLLKPHPSDCYNPNFLSSCTAHFMIFQYV